MILATHGILANSVPPSPLNNGLVAVYKGENNANDSYGSINGTAMGGLTYSTGKSGNAFTYNNLNSYVQLPDSFKLSDSGSNAFSINFWVYLSAQNENIAQGLFTNFRQSGSDGWGWMIWYYTGKVFFSRRNGTSSTYDLTTPLTYYNLMCQITVTRKNGATKLYINGNLVASDTSTVSTVYTTTHYPMIGVRQSYSPPIYDWYGQNGCKIDELNIWSRELTSTEVTELYNSGSGKFYPY